MMKKNSHAFGPDKLVSNIKVFFLHTKPDSNSLYGRPKFPDNMHIYVHTLLHTKFHCILFSSFRRVALT